MGLVQERPQVTFLNVSLGKLRNKKMGIEAPGYEGIITGIRLIKKTDNDGREREELQIRMADPSDKTTPNVIISGLFESMNGVTVWARMLIARLLKATRESVIGQGTPIQLGVYTPKADSKATCTSLRVPGYDASPIQGIELPINDPLLTRGIIRDGITELIGIYGDLNQNAPSHSFDDDSGYDEHEEEDALIATNSVEATHPVNSSSIAAPPSVSSSTVAVTSASNVVIVNKDNEPSIDTLFAEFERCAKKAYGESWEAEADDFVIELFRGKVMFAASMTREQLIQAITKLRADLSMPTLADAEMMWKTAKERKWTRPAFNALLAHYELKSEYEIPNIVFRQFLSDVRSVEIMQDFLKQTANR